jgi:hypothetical protein
VDPQTAGYAVLAEMVRLLRYKPGWSFRLAQGATSASFVCTQSGDEEPSYGWGSFSVTDWRADGSHLRLEPVFLTICVETDDATAPGKKVTVQHTIGAPWPDHHMPWHAWLKQCIIAVEMHEIGEWIEIGGQRPFYPEHGPNADLYALKDRGLEWPPGT